MRTRFLSMQWNLEASDLPHGLSTLSDASFHAKRLCISISAHASRGLQIICTDKKLHFVATAIVVLVVRLFELFVGILFV